MYGANQDGPLSLSTVTGANILDLVANAIEPLPLVLSNDYIYDGGCEYSYVIDLDTNELEVKGGYPEFFLRFEIEGLTTMRFLELVRDAMRTESDEYDEDNDESLDGVDED